jgi:hypothetical protein
MAVDEGVKPNKDVLPGDDDATEDGGLKNTWLIDSNYSRHMTGSSKWFSSLDPV